MYRIPYPYLAFLDRIDDAKPLRRPAGGYDDTFLLDLVRDNALRLAESDLNVHY